MKVYTLAQAADELGVSPSTLRHQVQRGSLSATLIGKTYVVDAEELERYRREHAGKHRGGFPARHGLDTGRIHGTKVFCLCGAGGTAARLNEHLVAMGKPPVS